MSLALVLRAQRDTILTISLIVGFLLILLFPLFFILKSCVEESVIATNAIVAYINGNQELQALLQDYKNSPLYWRFTEYAATWGTLAMSLMYLLLNFVCDQVGTLRR